MSNIMSQVKLKNKTSRNGFDLSRKNAFTAKVGELLPVACIECIPGDNIKGRIQHFTRTMPVNTAAYTRVREYYDWFFVPTNLLWNKFNSFVTQMTKNSQHSYSITQSYQITDRHPYFTVSQLVEYIQSARTYENAFGFNRANCTIKLLNYLGYGDYTSAIGTTSFYKYNANLNPFPLLAYQKIYQDYFRNSQWENAHAPAYNVDYLGVSGQSSQIPVSSLNSSISTTENMFDLRYSNWNKDLFMGLLPESQYGDAASVFVSTDPYESATFALGANQIGDLQSVSGSIGGSIGKITAGSNTNATNFTLSDSGALGMKRLLGVDNISFSILALRQAEALQKWKEITQSQQQDYKNQIESHFGVSVDDAYSERCKYVDGSVNNLDISEVTNTNITGNYAADIAGKGVGVGDANFNFKTDVHGYLMCIYHAVPLLDYALTGIHRTNLKNYATDYAIPEFDATGMVSVPLVELTNTQSVSFSDLLGYAPRYYDYKQAVDEVHGAFRGSLSHWVAPVTDSYLVNFLNSYGSPNSLDYKFFKVNPSTLNPIFVSDANSELSTDQLLVNTSFDITAVRNLDRNGLPY